jgi:hypothetical protein
MNTDGLFENATPASQQTSPAEERKKYGQFAYLCLRKVGNTIYL